MRRIFTAALILLSTAFLSLTCTSAYAALCTRTSPLATLNIMDDITLNVIKQREVGKVLWSKSYQVPDVSYTCDASTQSSWHSSYSRSYIRSQLDHVYNTEIPGIGIRMRWPTQTESSWLPGNSGSPTTCSTGCGVRNSTVLVEMVQTGAMPEGEYIIPAGKVAEAVVIPTADASEKLPIMAINFGVAIKVITAACTIYPSATNIDLGTYNIADFQNNDSFQGVKKDFSITVGCPSTEDIGITFNSLINTPLGALSGVIGVESGDGYASNFSIRLFEKYGSAISLGNEKIYTASTLTKNYQAQIYVGSGVNRKTALTPGRVVGAVQYTVRIK
ncbi:fimbrial protein [Enterobacter cancerogenus]|uniref:fimbrial protein n=1 Tax=Enterobacter cancerogenus TaxID=69218 RepID=UPI000C768BB1|nr:fimbrial protein [Enterobacter cancerogenus]AUJ80225.1 fimbrial protein [Enterobacter cancerogenus]PNF09526.1 fimbrial protein [Enterobacter cancerogenus]